MAAAAQVLAGLLAVLAAAGAACRSDLDCSLNGVCTASGACACDAPWGGAQCASMGFRPSSVRAAYGYGQGVPFAVASWGGNVLRDSNGQYHLFVAEMTGNTRRN